MKSVRNLDVNINMCTHTCHESRRGLFGEGKETTGGGKKKSDEGQK